MHRYIVYLKDDDRMSKVVVAASIRDALLRVASEWGVDISQLAADKQ
jgi:hypothetical protein